MPPLPVDLASRAALARLYDVDLLDDPGDVELYLALARRSGGPVLELAVGSGRIAVPLAREGYRVTGVDIDPAMLARARKRAEGEVRETADRLELLETDLLELELPGRRYRLAILALNSLLLLASREAQRRALARMARHLAPGGLAVVDVWLPDAEDLVRYDGRLSLEYVRVDPETNWLVAKTASAQHQAALGTVAMTSVFEEGEQGGPIRRWIRQDVLRLVAPDELRSLAESAGMTVEVLAGNYELDSVEAYDDRAVLIARRRERSRSPSLV